MIEKKGSKYISSDSIQLKVNNANLFRHSGLDPEYSDFSARDKAISLDTGFRRYDNRRERSGEGG